MPGRLEFEALQSFMNVYGQSGNSFDSLSPPP
jgi:hypothetical protein